MGATDDGELSRDLDGILLVVRDNAVRHHELEAAVGGNRQPAAGEVGAGDWKARLLVVLGYQFLLAVAAHVRGVPQLALHFLGHEHGAGCEDAEHGDGAPGERRLVVPRHVEKEQVPLGPGHAEDDVEAVVETDVDVVRRIVVAAADLHLGARPLMDTGGDVVPERRRRADEAAGLERAAARPVRARLLVGPHLVVERPRGAAVGDVAARDAGGLHHALHGVAAAVPAGGDAASVALAAGDRDEFVTARRAHHHVPVTAHEDGGLQRQEAQDAVQGAGVLHRRAAMLLHPAVFLVLHPRSVQ
jgi:hypothetical protein